MKISINKKRIGDDSPVYFIAEAGINHNGDSKIAKKLISAAKDSNADAVKFQTFRADDITTTDSIYYKLLKNLELDDDVYFELSDFSKSEGITFLSTPFSNKAVELLSKIKLPAYKIASGDLTDFPLLENISKKNKPIILSTGMANLTEIKQAVKVIEKNNNKIILLHSISGYPYPIKEANLKAITTISKNFDYPVGFSDNGNNNLIPLMAVALGAKIIEKHFTLNKKMKGPDQPISATPNEFANLVQQSRDFERMLGDGIKKCQNSEISTRKNARRSLTALSNISKGEKIMHDMIAIKRPATGIEPKYYSKIIGKFAKRNIKSGKTLHWNDIK
ncbi:N-acetylneuraminate synthase family protein [Nitrosopumilus sp.]|uniref:N-acetylneuraminate synthase family protein n=1 Tax=Nitrosopumilus sp. TaxID=2024843 RepID=UPI00247C8006|nr:N-acetylneuraminate synthase family protein [Nitrosopumilus sp.]MCV0430376.1 N-acetylneuraminate synthase family protein [Nitrosopumilus sp.]